MPPKPRTPRAPKSSSSAEPSAVAPKRAAARRARSTAPRESRSDDDEREPNDGAHAADGDHAGHEGERGERGDHDDGEPTEVTAEVVADPIASDEDEDAPIDEDDEERVVAYADDPDAKAGNALSRLDPMAAYLHEVHRHPLLTPEQELELSTRYFRTGDVRAAHTLVTSNLRLVVKIAYEYRRAYKNIMDLVQEGNIGLMQAVKKYDPTRGVKLSSYAAWWIRAYILRYILNNWRMVKLGTTQAQRKLFFNLNKEKQRLLSMGVDPTAKLIAERLDVDEKEVQEMDVRLGASEASIDAPIGGDSDGRSVTRGETMASHEAGADDVLADLQMQSALRGKLATFRETLKGKDLEIFDLRLTAQDDPLTLQELGDKFGVSRERVRQLEARLVGKLRVHLKAELDEAARAES
ncbi:MAG: RNA polymerase sigma factor RpoD/SigA [Polyangiales bacterium]